METAHLQVDIKGFYSKIHQEIAQLKIILIDSQSVQTKETVISPVKKEMGLSIKGIEKTQEIIRELKKEMGIVLNS